MTNISFTNRWSEKEKKEIRKKIEEALKHFPDLGYTIRVGRTESANGQFVAEKEHNHNIYIRLSPEASIFTVAHELNHHMTREKAMDLRTLALDKKFAERGNPSYLGSKLGVPSSSKNMTNDFEAEEIHEIALEAVNQKKYEPVYYFEKKLNGRL